MNEELATMGGGCFWCLDAVFRDLKGVKKVESGYSGGTTVNPSYKEVCSETTGHAEVIQITFDPQIITYKEILEIFFSIHDPTTLNRQGNDVGTQYRSIILYHSPEQKKSAELIIQELEESKEWKKPIVTELIPLEVFYKAEEYHQDYFRKNPYQSYCQFVIAPKITKFRSHFQNKLNINH